MHDLAVITVGERRWVGRTLTSRMPPAWVLFIAGCCLLIIAYFGLPVPEPVQSMIYTSIAAITSVALAAGVWRHRPAAGRAWLLLAASQVAYCLGDVTYYAVLDVSGEAPYPGLADVFYLAAYPLLAGGLSVLVRRRTPGWRTPTLIDAMIIGAAATLLWWVYVLHPLMSVTSQSLAARTVSSAYPVLDLLVLAMALRLMLGAGPRTLAYYLLAGNLVTSLAADVVYGLQTAAGTFQEHSWVDGLWLGGYALLGAAGLHPSMRRLDERAAIGTPDAGLARLVALALASLAGPVVLEVEHIRGRDADIPAIAAACAIMFLLVLSRMAGLVAAQRHEAVTDALTGLYTRRFFEENLREEAERADRAGTELSLVLVDADYFKQVNDTHGHPGGDRVLVELARRLRASCRPGDIVARIGGEEFAILLPAANLERADRLAERVRQVVAATPFVVSDVALMPLTVSIGVATARPGNGHPPTELIRAADQALYAAKRDGRNRIALSPRTAAADRVATDHSAAAATEPGLVRGTAA
jgi:two-component system cell cycle response regulator